MKNDIRTIGNTIDGRQGWAYICNSGKYPVMQVNLKSDQLNGYARFQKIKVAKPYRNDFLRVVGNLEHNNGKWIIGGYGSCLKASFTYDDKIDLIESANLPVVKKDDVIAIAINLIDLEDFDCTVLKLFKVGRIDLGCMTMAELTPLNETEMAEIVKDANDWCSR